MLKFKTSCAVLANLSSNLLNEVGLSLFRYFEVGLRVCDIVVNKYVRYLISWWVLVFFSLVGTSRCHRCDNDMWKRGRDSPMLWLSLKIAGNGRCSCAAGWRHLIEHQCATARSYDVIRRRSFDLFELLSTLQAANSLARITGKATDRVYLCVKRPSAVISSALPWTLGQ